MAAPQTGNPKITVVIPLLNEASYLRESLDSLFSQNYKPLEVIVYDGGSTDGTLEILKSYPVDVNVEPGLGQMAAINKGWRRSSAEFVTWWAGDDRYRPGAIKRLVEEAVAHPEAGLVHGAGFLMDEKGKIIGPYPSRNVQLRDLVMDFPIMPQSVLIRRKALERSGMMDEKRRLAADWDLFLRLAQYSPLHFVPFAAADRRMHADSEDAKNAIAGAEACIDVVDAFFKRRDLTREQIALKIYGIGGSRMRAGWLYTVGGNRALGAQMFLQALGAAPSSLWRTEAGPRLLARLLMPGLKPRHLAALKQVYHAKAIRGFNRST